MIQNPHDEHSLKNTSLQQKWEYILFWTFQETLFLCRSWIYWYEVWLYKEEQV